MIFQEADPLYCPFLSAKSHTRFEKCIASACALWEGTNKSGYGYCGLTQGQSKEPAILDVIEEEVNE